MVRCTGDPQGGVTDAAASHTTSPHVTTPPLHPPAPRSFLISWKSPRITGVADQDWLTASIFFGVFLVVGVLSAAFLMPYFYRQVWLGWYKLQLWHMPLMCLPSAWLVKLVPGIDERSADFDDRHLRGEPIPDDEAWQWHPKDVAELARKRRAARRTATLRALEAGGAPVKVAAPAAADAGAETPTSTKDGSRTSLESASTTDGGGAAAPDADAAAKAAHLQQHADEDDDYKPTFSGRPIVYDAQGLPLSAWKMKKHYLKVSRAEEPRRGRGARRGTRASHHNLAPRSTSPLVACGAGGPGGPRPALVLQGVHPGVLPVLLGRGPRDRRL